MAFVLPDQMELTEKEARGYRLAAISLSVFSLALLVSRFIYPSLPSILTNLSIPLLIGAIQIYARVDLSLAKKLLLALIISIGILSVALLAIFIHRGYI